MRIRNRLVGLVVGVLSVGAAVAMFPAGGSASGQGQGPTAAAKPTTTIGTDSPRCNDAKKLQRDSLELTKGTMPRTVYNTYKAKLNELVNTACSVLGTCPLLTQIIADLRTIRAPFMPPDKEATLREKEDAFLATYCSS